MPVTSCTACGAPLSVYDRVCECGALVHAAQLVELRTRARIGRMAKDKDMATGALRRALQLVPEEHPEHAVLATELESLLDPPESAASVASSPSSDENADTLRSGPDAYDRHQESKLPNWLAPLGVVGLMLWKFKGLLLLILRKGKLLLVGFTQ